MKICITGAGGFIGKALVGQLTAQGHIINLLTRVEKSSTVEINYFVANLLDENACLDAFLGDASVIYHCAGEIKNVSLMHGLHVDGTRRLLAAVERGDREQVLSELANHGDRTFLEEATNETHSARGVAAG